MGLVKSDWIDAQEQGWRPVDKHVCKHCVGDVALQKAVQAQARLGRCDYCGRRRSVSPVEALQDAVYAAVWTYYHEPADAGVPWDGGYIIEPLDVGDVLDELGFEGHPDLIADIVCADLGNGWVAAAGGHWASAHEHEVMLSSWSTFSELIKHRTRFHFGRVSETATAGPQEIEPGQMLAVLGERLRPHIREIAAGTMVYRVRIRGPNDTWRPTAGELGAPPPHIARAGRMNPAGIPYLYTSFDRYTAEVEAGVSSSSVGDVFVATFEVTAPLLVVDLTRLPKVPSIFDVARKDERERALFVHGFADAISQPVAKNGQEHVEYVPSQVVSEYLAQVLTSRSGTALGGLVFPSAVRDGGENLVVFPSERGWGNAFNGVDFRRFFKARRR